MQQSRRLVGSGCWRNLIIVAAKGRIRRYAIAGTVLGALAALVMIGDPRITDRFLSTFVSAEERDSGAQSRVYYAKQALKMIGDRPLGSGAEAAFKKPSTVLVT